MAENHKCLPGGLQIRHIFVYGRVSTRTVPSRLRISRRRDGIRYGYWSRRPSDIRSSPYTIRSAALLYRCRHPTIATQIRITTTQRRSSTTSSSRIYARCLPSLVGRHFILDMDANGDLKVHLIAILFASAYRRRSGGLWPRDVESVCGGAEPSHPHTAVVSDSGAR
jgi:hypothetical protein